MNPSDKSHDVESVQVEVVDGVAVLTFDVPGERQNTLSEKSTRSAQRAFERVLSDDDIRGAVLVSGKPDFLAGADLDMLRACRTSSEVEQLSREMHALLDRVEKSSKPIVAAIHGACLGGGLEVALACHFRIATDHPKTVLALPEVMLGLLPGGGGTQRLPALIGLQAALDLLLTGKNVRAARAKKLGLVDKVTTPWGLREVAIATCQKLIRGELAPHTPQKTPQTRALEDNPAGRVVLFHQARAQVQEKTGGLYPAPAAILDVVEIGESKGREAGLAAEARRFGELALSNEAASLMALFRAQTALKKNRFGKPKRAATTIGVVGAGLMGAGIALVSAQQGVRVLLKDTSREALARGQRAVWTELDRRVQSRAMLPFERDRLFHQVLPKLDNAGFEQADVVIEAVFEDLELKQRVLGALEEHLHPECVIASNTSALPIARIAESLKRPENVLGMHYFSPVQKMPLLEVVITPKTSKEACARAVGLGLTQGKTVIVVKDSPGFYTTRILAPLTDEAAHLAREGVEIGDIDRAMKAFGFPVGPITLLDEVGIDVAAHVARDLAPFFLSRFGTQDSTALDEFVKAGFLGRKSGKGFYIYDDGQRQNAVATAKKLFARARGKSGRLVNPAAVEILQRHAASSKGRRIDTLEIQQRIALRMVNEAVQSLQDGVLENPVDGDVGAVFGLGFPPMRGGPFRYIDTVGASHVTSTLERLAAAHGRRFAPADLLVEHAKKGLSFHSER